MKIFNNIQFKPNFGCTSLKDKSYLKTSFGAKDSFTPNNDYIKSRQALYIKNSANEYFQNNDYKKAIELYKKAVEVKPDFADAYYNLANSYKNIGDMAKAADSYAQIVRIKPDDVEAKTYMGECLMSLGNYKDAKTSLEEVLETDPKYDLASRLLKETENRELAKTDPEKAKKIKDNYAEENIKKAHRLIMEKLPPEITNCLKDIKIVFNETQSLNGHQNIAQYENKNKKITVTKDYIWAAPEVIAAYLAHEAVHASDHDPYTSVKEEQDAYKTSVVFWIANSNGIKDPEMDYATTLYNENPSKLDEKVAEVYRSRDSEIPDYSPNHGKGSGFNFMVKMKLFAEGLFSKNDPASKPILTNSGLLSKYCR